MWWVMASDLGPDLIKRALANAEFSSIFAPNWLRFAIASRRLENPDAIHFRSDSHHASAYGQPTSPTEEI
jgi:hypothetical protein